MTALLAAVMRDWFDLLVITSLLSWNAYQKVYSIIQSDDRRDALVGDIMMAAMVVREGKEIKIPAVELVPGDVVHVSQV